MDVTASTLGTYVNTTENIFLNDIDSGVSASANLMVEDTPSSSCTTVTIAQWNDFTTYNTMPPLPSVNNTGGNAIASYTGTQGVNDGTWWYMQDASTIDGDTIASGKNYWQFQISTTGMSEVQMSFNYAKSANQSAEFLDVYYGNNDTFTPAPTKITTTPLQLTVNEPSFQTASGLDFTGVTNTSGDTYFFVFPYGAQNSGSVWTGINDITFTACLPLYSIQKSFSPDPIPTGDTSVLTIQLNNDDTNPATNAEFSDTLPDGMTITTPTATSDCGGTLTAVNGNSEISLTGGTIPASSSCTINVNVTTTEAGVYPNTSSYLTVNGTAVNSKASDTLTVLDPPVISKAFSPNPIYAGNTSDLTFTIQNPNTNQALSGVSFTDTFPANLTLAATPTTPQCGGTVSSTSGSITLTGGTIAAGDTCTVTASVTSDVVGEYANTSGAVSATETGAGNTASDTLVVQAVHPGIAILKEVSTGTSGPWANQLSVAPSGDVYYRITVENIGDVPLTSITVSDVSSPVNATVDTAITSCSWPSVLPVGTSTQDPSATCIVGPFTAVTGTNDNTATAHGTYNGTVYNSDPDAATYATTSLSLDKTVAESSFNTAGDALNFTYTITNESAAPLTGVFQLNDTNMSNFTCTQDSVPVTVGTSVTLAANNPGDDDTIVCNGVYSVTAFDVSVGSVTNTAYATIGTTRSNSDRVTVYANDPDLIVSKTNDTNNNATVGSAFTWQIRVSNQGPADAAFSSGETILSDALPSGATYSISAQPSEIANILCAIDGSNVLTCTANGSPVTIPATSGYFTVSVDATPTATGSLSNSQATADPNDTISESNEGNNVAGNAVNVTAAVDLAISKDDGVTNVADGDPVSYSIVVTNNGPSSADGAVFTDPAVSNLTVSSVTCGSATNGAACPAVGDTTVTLMQGVGIVIPTLPSTGSVTFTVSGTAGSSGTINNVAYINSPSGTADSDTSNNSASDTDTIGTVDADLSITKNDSATNVTAGATVDYEVVVTNSGPSAADGAILTDPAVANLTVTGVTCDSVTGGAVCPIAGNTTVVLLQGTGIIIPTLPSGGTVTFTVSGTAGASGSIANTATITAPGGTTDPTPGNNSATDTDTIDPSADLSITKNDSATNVTAGATVNYEVVVTNNGPSAADGAVLTDPAVANLTVTGVTCDSVTGGSVCPTAGNTTVTLLQGSGIIIPTLPSGGTVTFTVSGTAGASGSIANTATITVPSGTTDPTPGNNSATDTDTIDPSADLSITKTDGVSNVLPGATVNYTVVVSNGGPSAADNAVLTDPAVANLTVTGVTCDSVTGGAVCPTAGNTTVTLLQGTGIIIPTLPNGGTVTFTVQGTAGASGSIVNVANIASPSGTTDSNSTNDSATDTDTIGSASADLSITKTDSTTSVTAGSTVTYTIVASNAGPSSADGAVFSDPSVSNLTVTSVTCGTATGGAACPASSTVSAMQGSGIVIPTLPSGGSVTFTVQGAAGASGSIANTATIAAPGGTTDPTPGNNSATDTDTIDPSADLSITKTDGVTNVSAGSTVSYTIVVSNSGPSAADGAVFTDASVTNLTVSSVTCGTATGGAACPTAGNTTVVLMQGSGIIIPTLPGGGSVTFTVEGTAASSAGSIVNVAAIAPPSGTTDPVAGNDSATDTDTILVPELTLTKSALPITYDTVGDTIAYTYVIENTGDVTLIQPFTIDDDQLGTVTCPATPTTLAPTDTITCTDTGTITQADLDTGSLTNVASASGYDGATEITSATDTVTVNATQTSSIGLAKELTAGPTEVSGNPGVYRFTFTFVVENFGNVSLSGIQVTDDLATAFAGSNGAGENNAISVISLTSSDFTVNWPGYDGDSDQNLLDGSDTLAGQASGSITMIVEFTPVISGDYDNTATVTGTPPTGPNETDVSQDGDDPDPDSNDDPTDNNDPTTVSFNADIFDPPSGEKIFNDSGYPVLRWTAVWINADNIVAVHARSTDEIPVGTTFAGSASLTGTLPASPAPGDSAVGVACTPASALTTTISCYYEAPTGSYPRGRIIWEGNLAPDYGANNAAEAANEITIVYDLNVDAGITSVQNVMEIDLDANNDDDFGDPGEVAVASASRIWPDAVAVAGEDELPNSGFAFENQLVMRDPTAVKPYTMTSEMMLTIPSLHVKASVVGIPYRHDEWDVSWLNDDAGWLNGTAYPTWQGNSVITGHVWDAYNQPGIFHDLKQLSYGQQIKIDLYGSTYVYEVRENRLIYPSSVNLALQHKDSSWITLLTCEGYQGDEGGYQYRRIVQAVLVKVE